MWIAGFFAASGCLVLSKCARELRTCRRIVFVAAAPMMTGLFVYANESGNLCSAHRPVLGLLITACAVADKEF